MLYGKRPFGEGCSQEKILRDEVMLNAKAVHFPAKPPLSAEGKEFISRSASCSVTIKAEERISSAATC